MSEWSHLSNAPHIDRVLESVKSHFEIWTGAMVAAWSAAWSEARSASMALIAYDDSAKYLDMPSEQLRVWSILSEDPAAILLLPAVVAFERINELECV